MSLIRSGALALVLALVCGVTAQAQQIDISRMVQAPPIMPLGEGVKVGYRIETRIKAGPTTRSFTSVVGETEDAWEVETNQVTQHYASVPGGKGLLMALVLDKKTFKVLSAKIGVPGGQLKEVKVMEYKQQPKPKVKAPAGKEEEFTLPSGKTVKATVTTSKAGQGQSYTSRVGAKGTEFEGVLLSLKGPHVDRALSSDPAEVDYELQDLGADGKARTVVGRELAYTDGTRVVMTKDPVAKCLHFGMLSNTTSTVKVEVLSLRTDAKPTLAWK